MNRPQDALPPLREGGRRIDRDSDEPLWADSRRVSAFVEFIEAADPSPWFVHLQLLDTHAGHHRRAGLQRVRTNRYDNLLRNADDHVRMGFDALAQRRLLDRTIIVITTDHSSDKSLGTRLRIPLMIRFPGGAHARREKRNVQLIDVAPTLLDALGAQPRSWMEGASLLRPPALTEQRVIYETGAVGPSRDLGPLFIDVPRPPHHGLRTIHAMSGSTWYSLELATGKTAMGPVPGHTEASEPAPMYEVLGGAREILAHKGWQELPRVATPPR